MTDLITEAISNLKTNKYSHLDAKYRNLIFQQLSNEEAINLILNTLYLNQTVFVQEFERIEFDKTIKHLIEFINGNKNEEQFIVDNNKLFTYYENKINDSNMNIGFAGLSIVRAGEEFLQKSFEVQDELNGNSDTYEWSSLFLGSLVYSNGINDIENINPKKNYDYWMYLLNNFKNKKYIFKIDDSNIQQKEFSFHRIQEFRMGINPSIDMLYSSMFDKFMVAKRRLNCKKIEIIFILINKSFSVSVIENGQIIDNTKAYLLSMELGIQQLTMEIKKAMYDVSPKEGAWLAAQFVLNEQNVFTNRFNYDNKKDNYMKFVTDLDFKEELNIFPRNKEFTPDWMKSI